MGIKIGNNNEIRDTTIVDGNNNLTNEHDKSTIKNKIIMPIIVAVVGGVLVAVITKIIG